MALIKARAVPLAILLLGATVQISPPFRAWSPVARALGPSDSTTNEAAPTPAQRRQQQLRAFHDSGVTLHKQGRLDEAIAVFSTALRLNPSSDLALYNRGNA